MTRPIYNPRESRWGNGVMFYSGARLPDVGVAAIDGPVSSMRMKAYRRGLQDYEYGWLLKQRGRQAQADEIVRKVLPLALADASGDGAGGAASEAADQGRQTGPRRRVRAKQPWSTDVNDWYGMREALASALAQ